MLAVAVSACVPASALAAAPAPASAQKQDQPTATHQVLENSNSRYQRIADWPQGTRFPFKVTGTLPSDLARKTSYEYWLVATPEPTLVYRKGTAQVSVVHADGTEQDVSAALSIGVADGSIVAGSADIVAAIPRLSPEDVLVLNYTCEYARTYNRGFSHGNPSWAHIEYTPPAQRVSAQSAVAAQADVAAQTGIAAQAADGGLSAQASGGRSAGLSSSPDVKATVYCYSLNLTKLAADTGKALPGAKFALRDSDGSWYVKGGPWTGDASKATVFTTGADGTLAFPGMDADAYTLVETKAPDGYEEIDPADVSLKSGIPSEAEWLKASSKDATVSGVGAKKGAVRVSATDRLSSSSGPGGPGDSGGTATNRGSGPFPFPGGGLLPITGDRALWLIAAVAALAAFVAFCAWIRSRRRAPSASSGRVDATVGVVRSKDADSKVGPL